MKSVSAEQAAWAERLARRLRGVSVSCADDEEPVQDAIFREEITAALREVAPALRTAYLENLAELFPLWSAPAGPPPAESAGPARPAPPEQLVRALEEAAPTLPEADRRFFAERLSRAGLGASAPAAPPASPEIVAKLGLPTSATVDAVRALRLLVVLLDFAHALDQLGWSVWKGVAPGSPLRRDQPGGREGGAGAGLRPLAARYLAGDTEVSGQQIAHGLDRSRQLLAGLLAGIGPAGATFARKYLLRFAPETIEQKARTLEGSLFSTLEQKCWREYQTRFGELSGPAVERELLDAIAAYAESVVTGGPPRAPAGADPTPPP